MTNRQIWFDDIQPVETLRFEPIEERYVKVILFRTALIYLIFMAAAFLILLLDLSCAVILLVAAECVLAAAMAVNLTLARKFCRAKGYALRNKDISYRSGLFFTTVTTVPFCKIQQVSIRVNPVSRLFGLYYLDVTNGSQDITNCITIPGLPQEKAELMKALLINNTDLEND